MQKLQLVKYSEKDWKKHVMIFYRILGKGETRLVSSVFQVERYLAAWLIIHLFVCQHTVLLHFENILQ